MPGFRAAALGGVRDPTLIVVGSGFWDIASWWANEGHFGSSFMFNASHVRRYVHGARLLIGELRRVFPRARLLWRSLHPGLKHAITPAAAHALNEALRAHAQEWGLQFLDVGSMVQQLPPKLGFLPSRSRSTPVYGTLDGRHLHEWLNLEVLNLILNAANEGRGAALKRKS